jgi:hypothetical protein
MTKELEKPGKMHQELMGYRKKNKLEMEGQPLLWSNLR